MNVAVAGTRYIVLTPTYVLVRPKSGKFYLYPNGSSAAWLILEHISFFI
jgi:hypothetical protein